MKQYLILIPGILIALTLHEWAHGFVSWKMGDPTPKEEGRLSFNPIHHLSLYGVICMLIFHFGWCKPVRVNPGYYKKPRLGIVLVALAGPGINILTGIIARFIVCCMDIWASFGNLQVTNNLVTTYMIIYYFSVLSLNLAIFNLIPIPPLDGSKLFTTFLPNKASAFMYRYHNYFMILLLGLLYLGLLDGPTDFIYGIVDKALDQAAYTMLVRLFVR